MKNSITNSNATKALIIAMAFIMFFSYIQAQKNSINLCVNYRKSGDGLGYSISPQIGYKIKSHEILLGTNIQKRNLNVSGMNIRYNYNLKRINNIALFLFCDVNYFNNAYLGNSCVKVESFIHPENASFYNSYKSNVIGEHAGFGIKFVRSNYFNLFALIGAGSYQTLSPYPKQLFRLRDKASSSLLISVGLNIKLTNQHKK